MGDFGKIIDVTKFRNENDGIYAFKPQPDRYLCFFIKGKKIIVTNAFRKTCKKLPKKEKDTAIKCRNDYLQQEKNRRSHMTTFEKFFNENPEQKGIYEEEYKNFLLSEFMMKKMEEENISVRELARRAKVSPTSIQKLRSKDAEKINLTTFKSVLKCLGYQLKIEKIPSLTK